VIGVLCLLVTTTGSGFSSERQPSGQIAFERSVNQGPSEIYVMNADGSGPRKLADGEALDWSPDGKRIAYEAADGIRILTVAGGASLRVVGDTAAESPQWSPDGRRLAYVGSDDGIFIVNSDGTGTRRLTSPRWFDDLPTWRPDGTMIAFERFLSTPTSNGDDVFVINADGSGLRRLTRGMGHEQPAWSPDGRLIAYLGYDEDKAASDGTFDVYAMNADGSNQRDLLETGAWESDPTWAPDSRRIAFTSSGPGSRGRDVHLLIVTGGHRNLSHSSRGDLSPSWSPDGRNIVFASSRDGNMEIYLMTASGRDVRKLTNTPKGTRNLEPAWASG
jgi:TolB protein